MIEMQAVSVHLIVQGDGYDDIVDVHTPAKCSEVTGNVYSTAVL